MKVKGELIQRPMVIATRNPLDRTVRFRICDLDTLDKWVEIEISDLDFDNVPREGVEWTFTPDGQTMVNYGSTLSQAEESCDRPNHVGPDVSQQILQAADGSG